MTDTFRFRSMNDEVIRLDSEGFHYRGRFIADAGEAHRLMVEFLKQNTHPQPEPQGLPPRVGHILRLAEIIREVDGNHDKGAGALAEAILSHPGSRWLNGTAPAPNWPWQPSKATTEDLKNG